MSGALSRGDIRDCFARDNGADYVAIRVNEYSFESVRSGLRT